MLSAFLSGRFKAESGHEILGHHKADLPVNQHMAPFSRYAQHPNLRSVRIQRHRVNAGRSLPSQIGALPIGILNRHLGQQFGLLVFGRVKIEELIFHISFKIADSNPAPSVVPFLNDCDRASIVIFAERRAVRRFFRAQIQSIRRNRIVNLRRRIAVVVIARPLIQHRAGTNPVYSRI